MEIVYLIKQGRVRVDGDCLVPTIRGGMPAPPLANSFEGGSDTTAITTLNSGGTSGDAFSAVVGTPTFSADQAVRGSLSMKIDVNGAGTNENVSWTGLGLITTSVYFRNYLRFPTLPGANYRILTFKTGANAVSCWFSLTNTGLLRSFNAASTQLTTSTFTMAADTWYRIEGRIVSSTTVGEIDWYIYEGHSDDAHEIGGATGLVMGADTDKVFWGPEAGTPPATWTGYHDDVAVSTTGLIGSSAPVPKNSFGPAAFDDYHARPGFGAF